MDYDEEGLVDLVVAILKQALKDARARFDDPEYSVKDFVRGKQFKTYLEYLEISLPVKDIRKAFWQAI